MSLKTSFARVLRSIRVKRNISQRDFTDASRTFLSKLESARSSLTLDKLEQISQRLELSPLTLLTLTLSLESRKPAAELVDHLRREIEALACDGGIPGLESAIHNIDPRTALKEQRSRVAQGGQTEITFLGHQ
ncbi:helix-turn-helix domain-containing protein [Pseudomonas inefficax]|uniref:helix-turn-helix domain-containing protein n=1 Tax=Pseudomonas inefficax TaxID=2078786 RepID=UPI004046A32A